MIGTIRSEATIIGEVKAEATISGKISSSCVIGNAKVGSFIERGPYFDYTGEYDITPNTAEQTLNTADRHMTDDVVVRPIPYYDVSNEYGRTIYIGGNSNA